LLIAVAEAVFIDVIINIGAFMGNTADITDIINIAIYL
jgi:hypothetical protein